MNLFNEGMIMIISTHLACFTDAVGEELTKYKYGWSMTFLIIFNMAVNLLVFFIGISRIIYLILKKYAKRLDHKMKQKSEWYRKIRSRGDPTPLKIKIQYPERI